MEEKELMKELHKFAELKVEIDDLSEKINKEIQKYKKILSI